MSATELRQAAETLRERAQAMAPSAPWTAAYVPLHKGHEVLTVEGMRVVRDAGGVGAKYIATMHPGVGLALASLLEETAESWDLYGAPEHVASEYSEFVHLARLINGGAS